MMQTELDLWPPLWEYSLACTKKFHAKDVLRFSACKPVILVLVVPFIE